MTEPLLAIRDLHLRIPDAGGAAHAVNGVNLELAAGDSLGIVGESGAGKSQLALAIMGLQEPSAEVTGSIRLDGRELIGMPAREHRRLRGRQMAMIFQDPMRALNPYLRVGAQLVEGMKGWVHQLISGGAGAPYYAQEKSVPWAAKVERFALQQHFIRVRVAGGEAEVIVTSLSGETLDRFPL